jgi:hypothetical protein
LNSLCDRCSVSKGTYSQELAALFVSVLGIERRKNYGVNIGDEISDGEGIPSGKVPKDLETTTSHDEENQAKDSYSGSTDGEKTSRQLGWAQCLSWDPCAIGSLPGRPV